MSNKSNSVDAAQKRQDRIDELHESFLPFAIVDDDGVFRIDPAYSEMISPFLAEIKQLRAIDAALAAAHERTKKIYADVRQNILVHEILYDTDDPIGALGYKIESLSKRRQKAVEEVSQMNHINPQTFEPEVLPEKQEEAARLRVEILTIPKQIAILQQAYNEARKQYDHISEPTILNRGFRPIPTKKGVIVPRKAPEMTDGDYIA